MKFPVPPVSRRPQLLLFWMLFLSPLFLFAYENPVSWEFGAEANLFILPDETYLNPKISADRGRFHAEVRYIDEALNTGSVFVGFNISAGETVEMHLTPIVGGVFGRLNGIAPGFLFELNYKDVSFTSDGEYFFSVKDKDSNFFYSWSEFVHSPADWIWFGIAGQRTRAYKTDLDIQRGLLLGFGKGNLGVTGYLMNIGFGKVFGLITMEYQF